VKKDRILVSSVWILGIVIIWEIAAFALVNVFHDNMASAKLPYLHNILITFFQNFFMIIKAASLTFSRSAVGFGIGALIGAVFAILMSLSKTIERIAFPYLLISQMIPILGLAPLIFNLFSMDTSRIIIAGYITFFPVAANMLSGFKSVEIEKRELMYSYAAKVYEVYIKLMLPFSMPAFFAGLKIAAPLSVTASILVDMLGSQDTIGSKILYSLYGGEREIFWALVLASALMGIVSYYIVVLAEKVFIPWSSKSKAGAK